MTGEQIEAGRKANSVAAEESVAKDLTVCKQQRADESGEDQTRLTAQRWTHGLQLCQGFMSIVAQTHTQKQKKLKQRASTQEERGKQKRQTSQLAAKMTTAQKRAFRSEVASIRASQCVIKAFLKST